MVNISRASSLWDPTVDDPRRVNNDVVKLQSSLYPWAKTAVAWQPRRSRPWKTEVRDDAVAASTLGSGGDCS